jgi:hypothetical protein
VGEIRRQGDGLRRGRDRRVVDVRPNGTMVLQAIKRRTVNGVQESLRLTGEVTPANVTAGKVSADHVLNLSVSIDADK